MKLLKQLLVVLLLYEALPEGSDFHWVNKVIEKSDLS